MPSDALEIVVVTSDLTSIVRLRAELVVESGGWREVHPWQHFFELPTVFQTYYSLQRKYIRKTRPLLQLIPRCPLWMNALKTTSQEHPVLR